MGANDVAYSNSCGAAPACYQPRMMDLRANLHGIVDRMHELAAGHPVNVVLLDYWSV